MACGHCHGDIVFSNGAAIFDRQRGYRSGHHDSLRLDLDLDVVGLWCRDFMRVKADMDRPFGVLNAHLGSRMKLFGYGFGL